MARLLLLLVCGCLAGCRETSAEADSRQNEVYRRFHEKGSINLGPMPSRYGPSQ